MNILFITNTLPPVVDGVGDYTLNLAREFARHGHKVTVVCKRDDRVRTEYDDICVCPVVEAWNRRGATTVMQIIKERKTDVVSLQYVPHGFEPHGLPFGLIGFISEIKKTDVPVFTFCHEVYWRYRRFNLKFLSESLLMAYISKQILRQSDDVATSISHYANMIKELCGKAVAKIPIASNIPVEDIDSEEKAALKSKIAPNGEFIVAFIGKRDLSVVSKAIKLLIADGLRLKLLLIGKTNNLQDIDENHVYRTGILDISDLSKFVSVADCMVMPERQDAGCSFKSGSLAAALSFGLPVITSKGIMTDEILQDRWNILFVNPKSEGSYYEAIASIVNDNLLIEEISHNAKAVGNMFTWQATYQRYMNIINEKDR